MRTHRTMVAAALVAGLSLAACGGSPATNAGAPTTAPPANMNSPKASHSQGVSPISPEAPVPTESSPPGDIPDNTQYVPYRSHAGGFKITTPEGWSRTATKNSVTFTDKLNTVVVSWSTATSAPTVQSATSTEVPLLRKTTRAFRLGSVKSGSLSAGPTVIVDYQANSDPNPVTGKQYRLDVLRYELFRNGEEAVITLLSPVGADNVDPWRIVTESFAWA
jgi:hypothetical protein